MLVFLLVCLWLLVMWVIAFMSCPPDEVSENILERVQAGCVFKVEQLYNLIEREFSTGRGKIAVGLGALVVWIVSIVFVWAFLSDSEKYLDYLPQEFVVAFIMYSSFAALAYEWKDSGVLVRGFSLLLYLALVVFLGWTAYMKVQQEMFFEDPSERVPKSIQAVVMLLVASGVEFVAAIMVLKNIGLSWLLIIPAMPFGVIWIICWLGNRKNKTLLVLLGLLIASPAYGQRIIIIQEDVSGSFRYRGESNEVIKGILANASEKDVFLLGAIGDFNPDNFHLAKFPKIPRDTTYNGFSEYKKKRKAYENGFKHRDKMKQDAFSWIQGLAGKRRQWTEIPKSLEYANSIFNEFLIEKKYLFLFTDGLTQMPGGVKTYYPPNHNFSWKGVNVFLLFFDYQGGDSEKVRNAWKEYFRDSESFSLWSPIYSNAVEDLLPLKSIEKDFPEFKNKN